MTNQLDTIATGGAALGGSIIAADTLDAGGDPINLAVQVVIGAVTLIKFFVDTRRAKKLSKNDGNKLAD